METFYIFKCDVSGKSVAWVQKTVKQTKANGFVFYFFCFYILNHRMRSRRLLIVLIDKVMWTNKIFKYRHIKQCQYFLVDTKYSLHFKCKWHFTVLHEFITISFIFLQIHLFLLRILCISGWQMHFYLPLSGGTHIFEQWLNE